MKETCLFSTGFNHWLYALPIILLSDYWIINTVSLINTFPIRFESNPDEIIQIHTCASDQFSTLTFLSLSQFYFLPILKPYLSGPICTMNYGQLDIYIHLPFPLGNLIIHPKHFLYFPFLTQFHGTHGERVDVKWNTRNPLMQEVGYDSQLKHYSYNFNLLLWLCNEALGCLSFQRTISRFWFRRKYNNTDPFYLRSNWFLTALFRELILERFLSYRWWFYFTLFL